VSSNHCEAHSALLAEILLRLGCRTDCRVWKINTGGAKVGSRFVRFGLPGAADISGILAGGRRLEIEVKTGTGRPSEAQRRFGDMIAGMGGLYVLARSVQDAIDAVVAAGRERGGS
jgi:hypothetical protein